MAADSTGIAWQRQQAQQTQQATPAATLGAVAAAGAAVGQRRRTRHDACVDGPAGIQRRQCRVRPRRAAAVVHQIEISFGGVLKRPGWVGCMVAWQRWTDGCAATQAAQAARRFEIARQRGGRAYAAAAGPSWHPRLRAAGRATAPFPAWRPGGAHQLVISSPLESPAAVTDSEISSGKKKVNWPFFRSSTPEVERCWPVVGEGAQLPMQPGLPQGLS